MLFITTFTSPACSVLEGEGLGLREGLGLWVGVLAETGKEQPAIAGQAKLEVDRS